MKRGKKARRRRGRKKSGKRRAGLWIGLAFAVLAVCVGAAASFLYLTGFGQKARIEIATGNHEIYEGDALPPLLVDVSSGTEDRNGRIRLDGGDKTTAADLVRRLRSGEGITLHCEADSRMEGTYPVEIRLTGELADKLQGKWAGKVDLVIRDGQVTVKNRTGDWDGDRFRRYDGSYVTDDFVTYRQKKYYFDAEGNKAVGWRDLADGKYCFDESGAMETGLWKDGTDGRYYLGADGRAVTGWQDMDGNRYYFDGSGRMATGDVYMGLSLYSFDGEGRLVSVKESQVDPSRPMVALTFDDGPGSRTGELLDQLEKHQAHATFFMLGQKVPSYPDTVRRMKEIGCELGNHSFDHPELTRLDGAGISSQIQKTNDAIRAAAGNGATVMRPPYGAINSAVSENVGLPMILWNIDTLDWKTRNAQKTIDTVMNSVSDGDIILMHDIHTESVDAAIALIPKLQEAGYQLVTVSELAAAKNVTLANGKSYTDF